MDLGLRGKAALVTGGSRGVGLSTARLLAEEGCHVGLCARSPAGLQAAADDLRARYGARVAAVRADVRDAAQAAQFVEQCAAELGGIDVFVNNVAGASGSRFMETADEDWRQTFEQTLFQGLRLIRLVVPHMRRRGGGAVVNIASISGWRAQLGGAPPYGAAKAALIFATERLALELAGDGIRVNTVSPGSLMFAGSYWDRVRQEQPEAFAAYARDGFPMGRMGTPQDVADVIVFAASPRAGWINGRHIAVDGLQQPVLWKG